VVHKNVACYFYFYNNIGKCRPILIILSKPHSQINCRKSRNKIYHLTSNLLSHYLAKFECSTAQLFMQSTVRITYTLDINIGLLRRGEGARAASLGPLVPALGPSLRPWLRWPRPPSIWCFAAGLIHGGLAHLTKNWTAFGSLPRRSASNASWHPHCGLWLQRNQLRTQHERRYWRRFLRIAIAAITTADNVNTSSSSSSILSYILVVSLLTVQDDHVVMIKNNKKLSFCWETVRLESMPRIAEMDLEMTI